MSQPSPLRTAHISMGARLVEFAGWEMPLQFSGIMAEHRAVRTSAGLFDVSHLGKILVEGPGAEAALDRILPGKVAALPPWTAGYNLVLDDSGGIVDDIFVYRYPGSPGKVVHSGNRGDGGAEGFLIVPNAANARAVFDALASSVPEDVEVTDAHLDWAIIALSGPNSREILATQVPEVKELKLHRFMQVSLDQIPLLVARTGYTGELTFEMFVEAGQAEKIWARVLELGRPFAAMPAGLGARDLLRLEMGYPLHGQDISEDTNPAEAGLEWVIQWDKEFRGKQVLEEIKERGPRRKLSGLLAKSRRIPRPGARLFHEGQEAGKVTSGNFSPTLDAGIALGYVEAELAVEGTMMEARLGGKSVPVEVRKTPLLNRRSLVKGMPETAPAAPPRV